MSEFRWIPLVWIESKGLEEDGFPEGEMIACCDMPMPGDEILTSVNGYVWADTAMEDDDGYYLDRAGSIGRTSMHGCQCHSHTKQTRRGTMTDKTMEQVSEDERKIKALLHTAWKSYHEKMEMLYKCIGIMHGTDADRIAAAYVAGFTDGYKAKENADA